MTSEKIVEGYKEGDELHIFGKTWKIVSILGVRSGRPIVVAQRGELRISGPWQCLMKNNDRKLRSK